MKLFHYIIQIIILLLTIGGLSYRIVYQQNQLVQKQMLIPRITKKITALEEMRKRLQYQIDTFENPIHLMELLRDPRFAHLQHPYMKDIIALDPEESLEADSSSLAK
jgi:hypothetical protein